MSLISVPPEWAPQDWLWIGFPHDAEEWPGFLGEAQAQIAASCRAFEHNLTLLDLVKGFAVFANGGYRIKPVFVKRIIDNEGNALEENPVEKERAISQYNRQRAKSRRSGKASAEEAAIAKTVSHEIEPLVQEQESRSRRARKPKQHAEARTQIGTGAGHSSTEIGADHPILKRNSCV